MSGGEARQAADTLAEHLRLFVVPLPAFQVVVRGVVQGRVVSLGPNRWVVLDDRCGSVCVRSGDEAALTSLHEGRRHALEPDVVDCLALGAMVLGPDGETPPMLVSHVLALSEDGYGSHVTIGMCDSVLVHASEVDAVMAHVPEALWRAGWIAGDYPSLDDAEAARIKRLVPDLIRVA